MNQPYLTVSFSVKKSPLQVFSAINDVDFWWSGEIRGETKAEGDEFTYRYPQMHYSKQKITELVAGQKVVWAVEDAQLSYLKNTTEWIGTEIVFELTEKEDGTEVRLTHKGLSPQCECFSSCSSGWGALVGVNLKNYIETGLRQPDPFTAQA